MDVFWEKGYNATSMQDLVDAMQINRSSLYNCFGDKHSLFMACLKSYSTQSNAVYQEIFSENAHSPLVTIHRIIDKNVEILFSGEKCCLGVKTSFELGNKDEKVKTILKQYTDKQFELLVNLLEAAKDKGELSEENDTEVLAHFILNSFCGWKQSYILNGDQQIIQKMAEHLKKSISS